ncbi:MAG: hypothetical protein AAGI46_10145 [Planctomycetota bacterium]
MRLTAPFVALVVFVATTATSEANPADVLATQPPTQAVATLTAKLDANDGDEANVRFALGVATVLSGVETLGRDLHAMGPRGDVAESVPFLRLPVPMNDEPDVATPAAIAEAIDRFAITLAEARTILQEIDGPVRVALPLASIGFDFDGDGSSGDRERLMPILRELGWVNIRVDQRDLESLDGLEQPEAPGRDATPEEREQYREDVRQYQLEWQQQFAALTAARERAISEVVIEFDDADVEWLIAYTHLIEGFADLMLAHDASRWFDHCGHLLFANAEQSFDFLQSSDPSFSFDNITDLIAAVHLLQFPVRDRERLLSAREHFLEAAAGSRRMFELIRAETDDGSEWIPNANQSAAFPNIEVTDDIIDGWLVFLDDIEDVLNGERLLPFWRIESETRGINLKRVFEEQEETDVLLWFQGTAAVPYLEEGNVATGDSIERLQRLTRGNFFTFAAWFN